MVSFVKQIVVANGLVQSGTAAEVDSADMVDTAVTPGSYTNADITVDQAGRITAAANGSSGSYTDEEAQDAVGTILVDSATIDFTYSDATPSITAIVIDDSISDAKLRDSAALSVIGRGANSTGSPADVAAGTDGHVLRRSGTSLAFGTVVAAGLADGAVTYGKVQNVTASRILGRGSAGGDGPPEELTVGAGLALVATALSCTVTERTEGTLSAAGSTQGTAAAIIVDAVVVSGADGTKGVILPNEAAAIIVVRNDDITNILKVYPHSGASIGIGATDAADSLGSSGTKVYLRVSSTRWVAATAM